MPNKKVDYLNIPEHMRTGVKLYLEKGILPGSFLASVLENKLVESFAAADHINIENMYNWTKFLYNEMPFGSWGSKEKVDEWIKSKKEKLSNAKQKD